MSPSSTLQKIAGSFSSGLGSGGGGLSASDAISPPNSGRGGGGVIRGLLQSIRAHTGLSNDTGSPRASRSGMDVSRSVTPQGSQSQQSLNVSHLDSLQAAWDDLETEDLRSRLSSGASGVGHSARAPVVGNNSSASLSHELSMVGIAASSSGRQSIRGTPGASRESSSATFAIPSLDTAGGTDIAANNSWAPSGSRLAGVSYAPADACPPAASSPPPRPSSLSLSPLAAEAYTTSHHANASSDLSLVLAVGGAATDAAAVIDMCGRGHGPSGPLSDDDDDDDPEDDDGAPDSSPDGLDSSSKERPSSSLGLGGDSGVPSTAFNDISAGGSVPALPVQHDPSSRRLCPPTRSASGGELSAMVVSQAVHRLQQRQQQEKAATRLQRSGGHGHTTLALHHQFTHSAYNHQHQSSQSQSQNQHMTDPRVGTRPNHRVLSVASEASADAAFAAAAGVDVASALASADAAAAAPAPTPASAVCPSPAASLFSHPHLSPARRLGLHQARSNSSSSPRHAHPYPHLALVQQQALFDSSPNRSGSGLSPDPSLAIKSPGGRGGGRSSAASNAGLDDWLAGEVPDMEAARLRGRGGDLAAEARSSISYTEGRISAAERLQTMVSSAAISGDDAASYLQQLLIPDLPSTGSVELTYSNTASHHHHHHHNNNSAYPGIPSVLALALGSSGGPAGASALAAAGFGGSIGGAAAAAGAGRHAGIMSFFGGGDGGGGGAGHGSPLAQSQVEPGYAGSTGASSLRQQSTGAVPAEWYPGSGGVSRAGSGFFAPTPTASVLSGIMPSAFPAHTHTSSITAGGLGASRTTATSDGSAGGGHGTAPPPAACAHSAKTAKQLLDELRELHTAAGPAGAGEVGGRPASSPAAMTVAVACAAADVSPYNTAAAAATASNGDGDGDDPPGDSGQLGTEDLRDHDAAAVAMGCPPGALRTGSLTGRAPTAAMGGLRKWQLQRQALREELVAALWRRVREKDDDAVSYVLAADPAAAANRAIASLLNDLRSWVYLNMW